jgi:FkbM family methyltransferase
MIKNKLKKFVGESLLNLCDRFPAAKPALKKWGLRTSKEWFGGRVVNVQLPGCGNFKLASVSQNYLSFELFWRGAGYYEPITTLVVRELAKPGDTFIDVGANVGFYSLVVASFQPGVKVIAFEPNPKNTELLHANVAANQLGHIHCEPVALSDEEGTAALYLSASDMSASLESDFDGHSTSTVQIPTTTLDKYLARHPVRGRLVVKVDVEGHEESFFNGARHTIASAKPDLITEVTFDHGEETVSFLRETGYRFYQITDQGLIESGDLTPVIREPFVFLNYLLSAKPRQEVSDLLDHIRGRVKQIDLRQTSKLVDHAMIQKLRSRQCRPIATLASA